MLRSTERFMKRQRDGDDRAVRLFEPHGVALKFDEFRLDLVGARIIRPFSGRRGDVTGTCIVPPRDQDELACAPEGGPPKDHVEE